MVNNDLTNPSGDGISPAPGSALDGYSGNDGSQHVTFIGTDGHVHELYIHPGAANWVKNDLTKERRPAGKSRSPAAESVGRQ